jgi:cytochrome b subunit of formate dehydrogenase
MSPTVLQKPRESAEVPLRLASAVPHEEVVHYVQRFDRSTRALHVVIMVTFLGLAATGMPLLFSDAPWARFLAALFGGFYGAGLVHRFMGVTLLGAVGWHLVTVCWRAFVRGEKGLFWGPTSMVPQPRDFRQFWQQMKWFFGKGPYPKYEHFTYWEKFDYLAVLWGTLLMGAAGLVLWFPEAASRVLPGWMFNVALFVHGAEASLAIGFIFVVHFFNGHLRPGKFPMDLVIFTGAVSDAELKRERAGQYERLLASGDLARMSVSAPPAALERRGRIIGAIGLVLGVGLFCLILAAVLR